MTMTGGVYIVSSELMRSPQLAENGIVYNDMAFDPARHIVLNPK